MPRHVLNLYPARTVHPFHALLLGGAFALFLAAMLADWAYAVTYEIQWKNFAAWLLVGALVFNGVAILFALFDTARGLGRGIVFTLLMLACFALGVIDAFVHAKDAWAAMPMALVLSIVTLVLSAATAWFGLATIRPALKGDAL